MSERVTKKPWYKKWWFWLIVVIFIILIIAGASGSSDKNNSSSSKTKTTKNNTEEKVPTEYKNAYEKAKDYMNFKGFSKKGLYEQLTSDAGEKFSDSAATYAVNKFSENDYKKAAVKSAKDYSENMHMSANEVYDQLTSDAGEKFTPAEAKYALDKLNLKMTKTTNASDNIATTDVDNNSDNSKTNNKNGSDDNTDSSDSSNDDPYAEGRKSQKESDDWMKKFEQGQDDQEKEDNPEQQQDSNDNQQSDSPDDTQKNDDNN